VKRIDKNLANGLLRAIVKLTVAFDENFGNCEINSSFWRNSPLWVMKAA